MQASRRIGQPSSSHAPAAKIDRSNKTTNKVKQEFERLLLLAKKAANIKERYLLSRCYELGLGTPQDDKKATLWLKRAIGSEEDDRIETAAEKGDRVSQYILGRLFCYGQADFRKDAQECLKWWHRSAENGYHLAQYALGMEYAENEGAVEEYLKKTESNVSKVLKFVRFTSPIDIQAKAFDWFEKAACQGSFEAQHALGLKYLEGDGVEEDEEEAIGWFELAADEGYDEAMYQLALVLRKSNSKDAVGWLRKAIDLGHVESMYKLAKILSKDTNQPSSKKNEIASLYEKAASKGHVLAQSALGDYYWDHYPSTEENVKSGAKWHKSAASQGNAHSRLQLAAYYFSGEYLEDKEKGIRHLFDAARINKDSDAQYKLGCMFYQGDVIKKDEAAGSLWIKRATRQGNSDAREIDNLTPLERTFHFFPNKDPLKRPIYYFPNNDPSAVPTALQLAWLHEKGLGVPINLAKANRQRKLALENGGLEKLREAAESGDSLSQFHLGKLLLFGLATDLPDEKEALRWLNLAIKSEKPHYPAYYLLGNMFYFGLGVNKNANKALEYYKLGAEGGDCLAQYNLGVMPSGSEGGKWLRLAEDQGYHPASMALYQNDHLSENGTSHLCRAHSHGNEIAGYYLYLQEIRKEMGHSFIQESRRQYLNAKEMETHRTISKLTLFEAAEDSNVGSIEWSLNHEVSPTPIDAQDELGNTALHIASVNNRLEAVSALLSKGANPDAVNSLNETPLLAAIKHYCFLHNPIQVVRALAPRTSLDYQDNEGLTAVAWAVKNKNLAALKVLLNSSMSQGELEKVYGDDECSPFLLAVKASSSEVAQFLLDKGSDMSSCTNKKENALHLIAKERENTLGKFLIRKGVSIDSEDEEGKIPIKNAMESENIELGIALMASHVLFLIANQQFECPPADKLELLFSLGGHVNQRDKHGRTLLHVAACCENEPFCEFLLREKKANPDLKDGEGYSVEEVIDQGGYTDGCSHNEGIIFELIDIITKSSTLRSEEKFGELLKIIKTLKKKKVITSTNTPSRSNRKRESPGSAKNNTRKRGSGKKARNR
ncbi:MAG: ankyrin repeat domain-containing protein [Chlamydiales bacterium]